MAQKKNRQTFEKLKREQAVREKRARKAERKEAARIAKAAGLPPPGEFILEETEEVALPDELAAERKVRGVRHLIHDEEDPHWILRGDVLQSLLLVEERGLVLELPVVWPRHLDDVPRLADAFPRMTIVIDHLGKPPLDDDLTGWARSLEQAAAHANVMAKISGLNTATAHEDWTAATFSPAVEVARAVFGRERLLCGSDWPYALLNGDYARIWRETRSLTGDDPLLLAANAVRLYGLEGAADGTH
jgi:L-fuconolactonase